MDPDIMDVTMNEVDEVAANQANMDIDMGPAQPVVYDPLSIEKAMIARLDASIQDDQQPKPAWLTRLDYLFAAILQQIESQHSKQAVFEAFVNLTKGNYESYTPDSAIKLSCHHLVTLLTITTKADLFKLIAKNDSSDLDPASIRYYALMHLQTYCNQYQHNAVQLSVEYKRKFYVTVNHVFIPGKNYQLPELEDAFHRLTFDNFKGRFKDLLPQMLLIFAGIKTYPPEIFFMDAIKSPDDPNKNIQAPGSIYLNVSLPKDVALSFEKFYAEHLGDTFCIKERSAHSNLKIYRFNLNSLVKLILSLEFKQALLAFMATMLPYYQLQASATFISQQNIVNILEHIAAKHQLSLNSDIAENLMAFAFGVPVDIYGAQIEQAKRYEGFATEVDFSVSITIAQANTIVANINAEFTGAAKLVKTNARLDNKGDANLQIFSVTKETFLLEAFKTKLETAFDNYVIAKPDMVEHFKKQLGLIKSTTLENSAALDAIADKYRATDQRLARSLSTLSLFNRQRKPAVEVEVADFEVKKAISAHIAVTPDRAAHQLFKTGDKAKIKALEKIVIAAAVIRRL